MGGLAYWAGLVKGLGGLLAKDWVPYWVAYWFGYRTGWLCFCFSLHSESDVFRFGWIDMDLEPLSGTTKRLLINKTRLVVPLSVC